jgi:hypothetical protein
MILMMMLPDGEEATFSSLSLSLPKLQSLGNQSQAYFQPFSTTTPIQTGHHTMPTNSVPCLTVTGSLCSPLATTPILETNLRCTVVDLVGPNFMWMSKNGLTWDLTSLAAKHRHQTLAKLEQPLRSKDIDATPDWKSSVEL